MLDCDMCCMLLVMRRGLWVINIHGGAHTHTPVRSRGRMPVCIGATCVIVHYLARILHPIFHKRTSVSSTVLLFPIALCTVGLFCRLSAWPPTLASLQRISLVSQPCPRLVRALWSSATREGCSRTTPFWAKALAMPLGGGRCVVHVRARCV